MYTHWLISVGSVLLFARFFKSCFFNEDKELEDLLCISEPCCFQTT